MDVDAPSHMDRLNWILNYQLLNEQRHLEVRTVYVMSELNVEADALSRPGAKLTAYLASLPSNAQRILVPKRWKLHWLLKRFV